MEGAQAEIMARGAHAGIPAGGAQAGIPSRDPLVGIPTGGPKAWIPVGGAVGVLRGVKPGGRAGILAQGARMPAGGEAGGGVAGLRGEGAAAFHPARRKARTDLRGGKGGEVGLAGRGGGASRGVDV